MTEENKYLDTLFQSKFAAFEAEPPAQVWSNIHAELHNKRGGSFNPVNLATIAALVLISGLLSFSFIRDAQHFSTQETPVLEPTHIDGSSSTLAQYITPANPSPLAATVPAAETVKPSNDNATASMHSDAHETAKQPQLNGKYNEEVRLAKLHNRRSFGLHTERFPDNSGISVRDSKVQPKYFGQGDASRTYRRNSSWQLGLMFAPSVSFYPDDSILNQRSYTFDASVKWIRNDFFIESGMGLSFSSDDGRYSIDYEKYLGSYDDVYNVTFDTVNGAVVPTYYTNQVNVFDSISKYRVENTKNRYTYLQIPLYVGFQKQVNRFGWFVKGGPVFSLLVNENIPQPDPGSDRIVGLDQQMAGRVDSYWQFAFSAGMSYQLSNRVSIAIEPTFRYYLNSQYDRKYIYTRHPYSIGLRTGLLFNF